MKTDIKVMLIQVQRNVMEISHTNTRQIVSKLSTRIGYRNVFQTISSFFADQRKKVPIEIIKPMKTARRSQNRRRSSTPNNKWAEQEQSNLAHRADRNFRRKQEYQEYEMTFWVKGVQVYDRIRGPWQYEIEDREEVYERARKKAHKAKRVRRINEVLSYRLH